LTFTSENIKAALDIKLIIVGTIPSMGDFLEVITRFVVPSFHAFIQQLKY